MSDSYLFIYLLATQTKHVMAYIRSCMQNQAYRLLLHFEKCKLLIMYFLRMAVRISSIPILHRIGTAWQMEVEFTIQLGEYETPHYYHIQSNGYYYLLY